MNVWDFVYMVLEELGYKRYAIFLYFYCVKVHLDLARKRCPLYEVPHNSSCVSMCKNQRLPCVFFVPDTCWLGSASLVVATFFVYFHMKRKISYEPSIQIKIRFHIYARDIKIKNYHILIVLKKKIPLPSLMHRFALTSVL
jgi:hypothetical protein